MKKIKITLLSILALLGLSSCVSNYEGTNTTTPSILLTTQPTKEPTTVPTKKPTTAPTVAPTSAPTTAPTVAPTTQPTVVSTTQPTPPGSLLTETPAMTDSATRHSTVQALSQWHSPIICTASRMTL